MIVISRSLVLSEITDYSLNPVIGWHTIVTVGNVVADSEETLHPASNLANPATDLYWQGTSAAAQSLTVTTNYLDEIDYLAVARHNFGSENIVVSVDGITSPDAFTKSHLRMDGVHGSTTFTDETGKTWTVAGAAVIDTTQFKFGGASGAFGGGGDYITTPDHTDFTLGSGAWTVDFWFRANAAGGTNLRIAGQSDSAFTTTNVSFAIQRTNTNVMSADVYVGGTASTVSGTTQFTNALNAGWHHLALVRTGNILRMFIDGIQEGGDVAIVGTVNNSGNNLSVGRIGELVSNPWVGWVDDFRLSVGVARWTANFTPPTHAHDLEEVIEETMLADDAPVLFRFEPGVYSQITLRMQAGDAAPEAGVLYVGKLLELERSIKIDTDHTPFEMGRVTKMVNGRSESGRFLGRIVLNEFSESVADFEWFDPVWYRANFHPFVVAGQETPFFFAWNPSEYPDEVGYAWLMSDPRPGIDPVTRRIAVSLKMQGIAA